jgi:Putative zinc-finger
MNCKSVRRLVSLFREEEMPPRERQIVAAHLPACEDCDLHSRDSRYLQATLRRLPRRAVPQSLTSRLIISASYDRERRQGAGEFSSPWQRWLTRARLVVRDLMKPLAVPAAGGLLSSILFFTMLVNTFAVGMPAQDDMPLGVFTQATVDTVSPFGFTGHEMTIELSIDKDGRVVGFSTHNTKLTREEINHLGRLILFTKFNPATADGQPVSGKILLKSFGIDVQG